MDSVIRGRLEIVANQVIVSASMVDARDERQVWGDRIADKMLANERYQALLERLNYPD